MTQSTLKRSAFIAVGIPVDLASKVRERWNDAFSSVDELRERLTIEAKEAFEAWAEEGESLIENLTGRASEARTSWQETMDEKSDTLKDIARGAGAALTEPIVPLAEIKGIGPANARKLAAAGVISTRALVERCDTLDGMSRLSGQTDIPMSRLETWVRSADLSRIDGIGPAAMSLLNALDIGTIDVLAEADAADLRARSEKLADADVVPGPVPSTETFEQWIRAAARLGD